MQACDQLEETYEKRFELERAALKARLADRDDQKFQVEESLQRLRQAQQGGLCGCTCDKFLEPCCT